MKVNQKNLRNSGVALVTVLVITAVTLALGYAALTISLSGLQGSKSAEHSVQARLSAESGLDAIFVSLEQNLTSIKSEEDVKDIVTTLPRIHNSQNIDLDFDLTRSSDEGEGYFYFSLDGKKAQTTAIYTVEASVFFPFPSGDSGGGGIELPGFPISDAAVIANATVTLEGSGKVVGDVYSKGPINLDAGGGSVAGNVVSLGGPGFSCGNASQDNTAENYVGVVFGSSAVVENNVYSACDIRFDNWSAYIHKNGTANRNIIPRGSRPINEHIIEYNPASPFQPVVTSFDDPLDIEVFVDAFGSFPTNGNYSASGNNSWLIRGSESDIIVQKNGVSQGYNSQIVTILGVPRPVIIFDSFKFSDYLLEVHGDVIIYSEGKISFTGGGTTKFAPDSSLTLITPDEVEFGISMESQSPSQLLIYSATNKDIKSSRSKKFAAGIYAPNATVKVGGSGGFYGAVYGKHVTVTGAAAVEFLPTLISDMTTPPEIDYPTEIEISRR